MFGGIYAGAKVLVTGNTGFKGSWLCLWLQQLGAQVVGLADEIPTTPALYQELQLQNSMEQHWVDVRNAPAVLEAFRKVQPHFVFHLAARSVVRHGFTDPLGTLAVNAMGTANVLDAIRQIGKPCSVIMVTSDKCYDNKEWHWGYRETDALGGHDTYSASKACAEHITHAFVSSFFSEGPIKVVSARAGNVIGGGDWSEHRLVPDFIKALQTKQQMELRHPLSTRPWQFVLEPLSGYLRLGQLLQQGKSIQGEAFNFGPGYPTNISVATLLRMLNERLPNISLADTIVETPAKDTREANLLKLNWDKAQAILQWQPILDFEETIDFTAHWYKAYLDGNTEMAALTQQQIAQYIHKAQTLNLAWTK